MEAQRYELVCPIPTLQLLNGRTRTQIQDISSTPNTFCLYLRFLRQRQGRCPSPPHSTFKPLLLRHTGIFREGLCTILKSIFTTNIQYYNILHKGGIPFLLLYKLGNFLVPRSPSPRPWLPPGHLSGAVRRQMLSLEKPGIPMG